MSMSRAATAKNFEEWEAVAKRATPETLRYVVADAMSAARALDKSDPTKAGYYRDQASVFSAELSQRGLSHNEPRDSVARAKNLSREYRNLGGEARLGLERAANGLPVKGLIAALLQKHRLVDGRGRLTDHGRSVYDARPRTGKMVLKYGRAVKL